MTSTIFSHIHSNKLYELFSQYGYKREIPSSISTPLYNWIQDDNMYNTGRLLFLAKNMDSDWFFPGFDFDTSVDYIRRTRESHIRLSSTSPKITFVTLTDKHILLTRYDIDENGYIIGRNNNYKNVEDFMKKH